LLDAKPILGNPNLGLGSVDLILMC